MNMSDLKYSYQIKRTADSQFFSYRRVKHVSIDNNNFVSDICDCQLYIRKIPLGLTATIVAIGLNVTGVLDASQTFSGYVNSNVILCVGMFVVGQALFETGMANKIGGVVTKFAKNEKILMVAIMVIVGVMSGFLSNTGTAAVLIPVVCGIADESGYARSRLLMPLVFAAALGGNLSIIGAPGNLMGVDACRILAKKPDSSCMRPSESQC